MPDNTSPGAPAAPNAGSIDADAIKAIVSEAVKPLNDRVEGQSKYIAKLEGMLKEVKPAAPAPIAPTETKLVEEVKELKAKDAKNEARAQKLREKSAVAEIRDALIAGGVSADAAAFQAKAFYLVNAQKVAVEENEDLDYQAYVVEGDKKSTLKEYAAAWLQTKEGSALIPSKQNPQIPGSPNARPSNAGIVKYTRADFNAGRYDMNVVKSGNFEVID
jgi:hypothetical protein